MKLLEKLIKLVYPNKYLSTVKQNNSIIENNINTHDGILLQRYLSSSIYWCDERQEYVVTYKIPDNILINRQKYER